jgi:nicotinamide phosphoribosyltransferase
MGFSAENLAFGMGGGLLQQLDRDTQKFALKCSAACVEGEWIGVSKDPITDPGKRSKAGRLMLQRNAEGAFRTVALDDGLASDGWTDALDLVWEDGRLLRDQTFAKVRALSEAG